MSGLLRGSGGRDKLLPFPRGGEPFEIRITIAVQCGAGNAQDSTESQQCFFIHFIASQKFLVIAKGSQEPVEFPQCPCRTVKPAGDRIPLMLCWSKDSKSEDEEGPLGMPPVKCTVHADQEGALQDALSIAGFAMQAWDLTLHEFTSWDLE